MFTTLCRLGANYKKPGEKKLSGNIVDILISVKVIDFQIDLFLLRSIPLTTNMVNVLSWNGLDNKRNNKKMYFFNHWHWHSWIDSQWIRYFINTVFFLLKNIIEMGNIVEECFINYFYQSAVFVVKNFILVPTIIFLKE